ncbi:MAG: phosphate acyltransferase PlsX [Clostridia bacterium]
MKIVVDCYGGDYSPQETVKGCLLALMQNQDINLVLTGNAVELTNLVGGKFDGRIEYLNASEVITNLDVPTTAIRTKKDSSLVVALDRVKNDDECVGMVSSGSTGAVLTGAVLKIGRIEGVSRPALLPLLPTLNGGKVLLIDCGANVDCKPAMLVQFAYLAISYANSVLGISSPRVALLSNGTEDKKGNEFTKQVFELLKQEPINFVGNMEARDILSGSYDIVVADGMYGNIALKACEGTATTMLKMIKQEISKGFFTKLGALLAKPAFRRVKSRMDYNQNGGAPFVGINKILIKAHGASKANSICCAIEQVKEMHKSNFINKIKDTLPRNNEQ